MTQQLISRRRVTPWLWRYGEPVYDPTKPTFVLAPFAGGSAYSLAEWAPYLMTDGHGVLAVQYPGRGPRATEPNAQDMAVLANNTTADLLRHTEGPLILVGHSMGGVVCHEVAVRLEAAGRRVDLLVVSASRPPGHARLTPEEILAMDRPAWRLELSNEDSGAGVVAAQPDLLDLIIPTMRADYLVLARHAQATGVVSCPILSIGGDRDPWVTRTQLTAWSGLTTGEFTTTVLPGGHFYYQNQLTAFSQLIHNALA
jgi:surfactin synthase thioesterase subunit